MKISDLVPWRAERRDLAGQPSNYPATGLQAEVNRLFDDFFGGFDVTPWGEGGSRTFMPRVDVAETADTIQVTAELPGLDQENIDISLSQDVLTIKGEKKAESEASEKNYYRLERSYGSFRRDIPLPAGVVDRDQCDATFKNGVLQITLPKKPEAQETTRRIAVKAE